MSNIIITRSRRGIFNVEEWETFNGTSWDNYHEDNPNPDTRVFFRCREPSCWKIWTLEQAAYRVIDIESNPIQCSECGSFNITATWCDVTERPNTWIGYGMNVKTGTDTFRKSFTDYQKTLKEFREDHGGQDPTPEDTAAWTAFQFIMQNLWIDYPPDKSTYQEYKDVDGDGDKELVNVNYPYDTNQYFEVFHNHLPNLTDEAFYTQTGKATKWRLTEVGDNNFFPIYNKNFYRCIINMVIQTEFVGETGGTGGSA